MKKEKSKLLEKLTTFLFYLSAFLFFIAFNFQDSRTSGWYQQFLPNLNGTSISDITFTDSLNGYAVTTVSGGNSYILKTTNRGDNWIIKYTHNQGFVKVKFINQSTGFTNAFTKLFKTTNSGENWSFIDLPSIFGDDMAVLNQDTIWLAMSESLTGGAFLSTNGGVSWQQKFSGGTENPNKIYMFNARIGFICNTSNGTSTRRTTNGGNTWTVITPNEWYLDIYFIDSLTGWRAFGNNMYKTTNGGVNWSVQYLPTGGNMNTGVYKFSVINKDTIWATGGAIFYPSSQIRGLVYRTTNGGLNWKYQIPDTSIHIPIYYFVKFINKNTGWAYGLNTGIHTTIGGDTTFLSKVNQISSIIPNEYKLHQNYPNPFNPVTKINYELPKDGRVKLVIYDILGREIKSLVNNEFKQAGRYTVEFNGTQFASGIYFYRIQVEDQRSAVVDGKSYTSVKKMALIK
jgi:photosystem II stability/assembly factor-like uncharacterized protein